MTSTETNTPAADGTEEVFAEADPAAKLEAKRVAFPAFPHVKLGPFGHLAEERARLDGLEWKHFTAKRVGATLGAELHGIDIIAELIDEQFAEVRDALHAYKVIFFRDQAFTPASHVAFARRFGDLEVHPFIPGNTGEPELVRFEKDASTGGYENGWHHDVTWRAVPSAGAILRAVKVPETGGDTLFCDMAAAYEGLDDEVKDRIENMNAVHDFMLAFGGQFPKDKFDEVRAKYPLVTHPVVIRHHATGKKLLYVNRFFTSHLADADGNDLRDDEHHQLLGYLCDQANNLEYQCRFQWRADSVAFWDNRAVQHYAASDYWPDTRIMERASIVGTRPAR